MAATSGSIWAPPRLDPRKSHPHDTNASTRWRIPLISQACTPSQAEKATTPWSSWWRGPTSATAEPRLIIAMIPLSRYWNGLRSLPWMSATMLCAAHRPACNATDPSAGRLVAVAVDGVGHVADRVHPRVAVGGEVGEGVEAAATTGGQPGVRGQRRWLRSARPHDGAGEDLGVVVEHDTVRAHLLDASLQEEFDTEFLQFASGIAVGLVGERAEHDGSVVDEPDRRPGQVEVAVAIGHDLVDEVGDGTGGLHPGRSAADDHDVERALVDAGGVLGGVLETLEQARAQAFGVGHRVQRERVLVGAGHAEVVGHRTGREDQVVRRWVCPPVVVTLSWSTSTASISACNTVTVGRLAKTSRNGRATSDAASSPVATW